jgi:hypothetical protein
MLAPFSGIPAACIQRTVSGIAFWQVVGKEIVGQPACGLTLVFVGQNPKWFCQRYWQER